MSIGSVIFQDPFQGSQGLPTLVTAGGGPVDHTKGPPIFYTGTAEPPSLVMGNIGSSFHTNDLPSSISDYPSGLGGPPAGFPIPAGATRPPPGLSIPSGVTGPPPGFTPPPGMTAPPAGVTGFPAGANGPPPGIAGPPSHIPAEAANHELTADQSKALIGVTCMLLVLCLAAVGGRLLARRVSRMRLEADDYLCLVALFFFVSLCIEQFLLAHYGIVITSSPLPPMFSVLSTMGKLEVSSQITYTFVTTAAKASLLMLFRRVFSLRSEWFRIAWWTNVAVVAAYFITLVALNCSCIPHQVQASSMGFINAVIDSIILMLPIRMVWALQMSHKQKVSVCGVFGLGLLGVAISLARAISIANPDLFTNGALSFIIWSTTEPAVALICACLPVLRPLYTSGLAKLNSTRASWGRYHSRKLGSYVTASDFSTNGNPPKSMSITNSKPMPNINSDRDYAREEGASSPFVRSQPARSHLSHHSQRINGGKDSTHWAMKLPFTRRARSDSDETAVTVWPTVSDQPVIPEKSIIQQEVEARRYAGGKPKNWLVSGNRGW